MIIIAEEKDLSDEQHGILKDRTSTDTAMIKLFTGKEEYNWGSQLRLQGMT